MKDAAYLLVHSVDWNAKESNCHSIICSLRPWSLSTDDILTINAVCFREHCQLRILYSVSHHSFQIRLLNVSIYINSPWNTSQHNSTIESPNQSKLQSFLMWYSCQMEYTWNLVLSCNFSTSWFCTRPNAVLMDFSTLPEMQYVSGFWRIEDDALTSACWVEIPLVWSTKNWLAIFRDVQLQTGRWNTQQLHL
jgi:hypothetical protein